MKTENFIKPFINNIKEFLDGRFDLKEDSAHQLEVIARIESGAVIRGVNLWVLIFATFIASLGLNVNSPAVIIGAMLISPLMGPIMGMGVALGIRDFALLKRSVKNFAFMMLISILASTLYFLVSPLTIVQSELLARTQPTTWDVLIAFFGGFAGMIALTRVDRTGTVVPGVAIATALMPPLCTAGFGIATGQFNYFIGAFYLFIINTVFIGLSALLTVNLLKYHKVETFDLKKDTRVKRMMAFIIFITIAPSVYIGYKLVVKSMFEQNVANYIGESFKFSNTEVVSFTSMMNHDESGNHLIEVILMGDVISNDAIETLNVQMPKYGIFDASLRVRQNDSKDKNLASSFIQKNFEQLILEKNSQINDLQDELKLYKDKLMPSAEISKEISALFNIPVSVSLTKSDIFDYKGNLEKTILICYMNYKGNGIDKNEKDRLINWLKARTGISEIKLFMEGGL